MYMYIIAVVPIVPLSTYYSWSLTFPLVFTVDCLGICSMLCYACVVSFCCKVEKVRYVWYVDYDGIAMPIKSMSLVTLN